MDGIDFKKAKKNKIEKQNHFKYQNVDNFSNWKKISGTSKNEAKIIFQNLSHPYRDSLYTRDAE